MICQSWMRLPRRPPMVPAETGQCQSTGTKLFPHIHLLLFPLSNHEFKLEQVDMMRSHSKKGGSKKEIKKK
jgi:hypothetical protein